MTNRMTLEAVNSLDAAAFVAAFAEIYEHSPWVAEAAATLRPFASVAALHAALSGAVAAAPEATRLALLRAHPDLAGKAALAGELTDSSRREQAAAGLGGLSPAEMARFTEANTRYRERFGFPFILAIKYWTKAHILAAFDGRLNNGREAEMATALAEVDKIAFLRLLGLVEPAPTGWLSTHVLDTARGCPAQGMEIELFRLDAAGQAILVKSARTNADGRTDGPLLADGALEVGTWQLLFKAGEYLLATGQGVAAPAFLDGVPIRFAIANPEQHYHVPLLLSPWAYSTYRGS
jgi:2-oxo-4-hydroxy-4-carboxy-5-ureidoimidazoline decarboxylase